TALDQPVVWPAVGGPFLPEAPGDVWRRGDHADVALVVGSNQDEATFFIALLVGTSGLGVAVLETRWGYEQAVRTLVGDEKLDAVLALYPYDAFDGGIDALSALGTDLSFACPIREWARAWTEGGGTVWQY